MVAPLKQWVGTGRPEWLHIWWLLKQKTQVWEEFKGPKSSSKPSEASERGSRAAEIVGLWTAMVVPILKTVDPRMVCNFSITLLILPGALNRGSDQLLNFRFRRSSADSVLVIEQWNTSSLLQGY